MSDADREDVMVLLKRHYSDGRLSEHELDTRAEAACHARFASQLRALLADLPAFPEPAPPAPRAPRAPWVRHALISLAVTIAIVAVLAALPSEFGIVALIVILGTLFALAFTMAPIVLLVVGVVWVVRTITDGPRRRRHHALPY